MRGIIIGIASIAIVFWGVYLVKVLTYDPTLLPAETIIFERCDQLEDKNLTHYWCYNGDTRYYVLVENSKPQQD